MIEEIPILLSSDEKYARNCAVTVISALSNTSSHNKLHFYILSPDFSDKSFKNIDIICQIFNAKLSLITIDVNQFEAYQFSQEFFEPNKYSVILGPNLCKKCTKILYLDCDLIILGDLHDIFQYNLDNKILGAVPQVQFPYQKTFIKKFNKTCQDIYFNSGVLLIDAVRWRERKTTEMLFNLIKEHASRFHYNDQDALNVMFLGDYYHLPGIWNVEARLYKEKLLSFAQAPEIKKRIANPQIIHYTGLDKPWSSRKYVPQRSLYKYYSHKLTQLTGWSPRQLEPKRASTISYFKFIHSCLYYKLALIKSKLHFFK